MIYIIDYGRGNLNNVKKAFLNFGYKAKIINKPNNINNALGLVLPGVGAFADSMTSLNKIGFSKAIKEYIKIGKPFLGICLGLQLLFESSNEFGYNKGLGILKGKVIRLNTKEKIPHIGWNSIHINKISKLFKSINTGSYLYFVHSFYAMPSNKNIISASCHYGIDFPVAIEYKNIYATQFHPEKSQNIGLKIIKNFGEICHS